MYFFTGEGALKYIGVHMREPRQKSEKGSFFFFFFFFF